MLSVRVYTFWGGLSLQDTTRLHICSKLLIYILLFIYLFLIYKDNVCPFPWIIAVEVHLEMICSDTQILFQVCFSQTISLYRSITCILWSQVWPAHFQDFLQTNNSSSEPSSVSSLKAFLSKTAQTMDFKMFLLPQPRWFFWHIKELYQFY